MTTKNDPEPLLTAAFRGRPGYLLPSRTIARKRAAALLMSGVGCEPSALIRVIDAGLTR
jgi:hypothetical protein